MTTSISIHAPHAGSDESCPPLKLHVGLFQSTLPMRGATRQASHGGQHGQFQSTLPMRGATERLVNIDTNEEFQSTLPMRGATRHCQQGDRNP